LTPDHIGLIRDAARLALDPANGEFRFESFAVSPLVGMRQCVALDAEELIGRFEPREFALDELVDLWVNLFGIVQRSDANGEVAVAVSRERVIGRNVFAVQSGTAGSAEETASGLRRSILGRRSFGQPKRVS
jgi:hypothetical protein